MIVAAKVRIEHYLSKQKLTIHHMIYFCHKGCPPSQIFGLLLPISHKQKKCSIVALYSFKAVGLCGGEDAVGTCSEEQGLFQSLYQEYLP